MCRGLPFLRASKTERTTRTPLRCSAFRLSFSAARFANSSSGSSNHRLTLWMRYFTELWLGRCGKPPLWRWHSELQAAEFSHALGSDLRSRLRTVQLLSPEGICLLGCEGPFASEESRVDVTEKTSAWNSLVRWKIRFWHSCCTQLPNGNTTMEVPIR